MPIRILPPEVASQIAAGEVVERHTTSKVTRAEDLFHISTLGFCGEALASIASVSRLSPTSRPVGALAAACLQVVGGHIGQVQPVGAPPGTTVRVEDLFYNVPARLKFLKRQSTERRLIDTLVTRYALAFLGVRFSLIQDGRPALQTSGDGDRRAVLAALYGVGIARQMLEMLTKDEPLRMSGFISPLSLTRSNRREMLFFLNRRPVQDIMLGSAMVHGLSHPVDGGALSHHSALSGDAPGIGGCEHHPTKADRPARGSRHSHSK